MTGPAGSLPMGVRPFDDKSSDTLVVGSWRRVLDGEFDSPPSPPLSFLCAAPGRTLPLAPVIVPPLLLFLVLQRSFIQGLTIGDIRR